MEKGITYIVRPFMAPVNFSFRVAFISVGSAQWLVGPASSSFSQQMKVRDSTRATSEGRDRARKELGRFSSLSFVNTPLSTICAVRRSHSSCEPSVNSTASGVVSSAIFATHSSTSSGVLDGAAARTSCSVTDILPPGHSVSEAASRALVVQGQSCRTRSAEMRALGPGQQLILTDPAPSCGGEHPALRPPARP